VLHDAAILSRYDGERLIRYFKTQANLDPVVCFSPHDSRCRFDQGDHRVELRLALAPSYVGEKLSLRILDSRRVDESKIGQWLSDITGFAW
jgi:type II secretory ATPase GspE/PulE/Tfp pilus assembly ATPase PilB-like protein